MAHPDYERAKACSAPGHRRLRDRADADCTADTPSTVRLRSRRDSAGAADPVGSLSSDQTEVLHHCGWSGFTAAGQHLHEPVPQTLAAHCARRSIPRPCRFLRRRLRHPQQRARERGAGVDKVGDDQARADDQRGENLGEGRPDGELRLPRIYVRAASLSQGWPLVSGREPIQEECPTAQDESRRIAGAR